MSARLSSSLPWPDIWRTASGQATSKRLCTHHLRTFTTYPQHTLSAKRQLVTATVLHPRSFDFPPPPRNIGTADTSISSSLDKTRPPNATESVSHSARLSTPPAQVSLPEVEAQKAQEPPPVRARKLRPRKAAMSLSPSAVSQLRSLLSAPTPQIIRVGVKNRGCSGLAYHLEYVEKPGPFDETVEQDGVKVLIDSKALFSIIGSEMDWMEDKLSSRFVFRNPNIKEQCGCGESFMV